MSNPEYVEAFRSGWRFGFLAGIALWFGRVRDLSTHKNTKAMRQLSVIIPSRTLSNLTACVDAVQRHDYNDNIIAVWDRSGGAEHLTPNPGYRVQEVRTPFVYSRSCNIGIEAAGHHDVILLNDDAMLQTPGGFNAMQRQAEEHPEFGVIAAVTNVAGLDLQQPQSVGLREVPRMVCFICVLIPRRTLDKVGLLDEEFVGYGYDDDSYCLRVRQHGLKIGVFDHCFVDHSSLKSTFRGEQYPSTAFEENRQIFVRKYGAHPL